MHAVPGAGSARLSIEGGSTGPVGFGGVSNAVKAKNGRVSIRLLGSGGNQTLARSSEDLRDGRYTVVATKRGEGVALKAFRDQEARKGKASLRAIHAAPELGNAALMADGRAVGKTLAFEEASPYLSLEPGSYRLEAQRPSGAGAPLATRAGVNLAAGTASTAVVAGSGGEPTTIIVASDGAVTPTEAPQTGLGGLAGGTPWLAALAAALLAAAAGGAAYRLAGRRA